MKINICIYIYIYNLHGFSCQEKVSRFSMLLIPRYRTSLAVSHWKLRMVLMVEYRYSRLDQNKPFYIYIYIYIMVLLLEQLKFDCECHKRFKGTPVDSIMN